MTVKPDITKDITVLLPPMKPPAKPLVEGVPIYPEDFEDFAIEIHEWLSMVLLSSPRIRPDDKTDPFLSRYVAPGVPMTGSKLVKLTWSGFLPPTWAHKVFVEALLVNPRDSWLACLLVGFGDGWSGASRDCTILRPPDAPNEYVLWEVVP